MVVILFVILASGLVRSEKLLGTPVTASSLRNAQAEQDWIVVDFRSDFERELEGFIENSLLIPENRSLDNDLKDKLSTISKEMTVAYAIDGGRPEAVEAEEFLSQFGLEKIRCYFQGMRAFVRAGGTIAFPRFIKFEALQEALNRDSVTLIDVRNRTELNEVGKIPGSVVLPLHEVDLGFDLSFKSFFDRFGFFKPDPTSNNVILTCRSGRRVLVADDILKEKGYDKLRIYSGSFKDWISNGGETIFAEYDLDYDILQ